LSKFRKQDRKGRSDEAKFVQLPFWLLQAPAARSLSAPAFKTLVYLVTHFNGSNNGGIGFGVRSGCFYPKARNATDDDRQIGLKPRTISDALYELEHAGFIACTKAATFDQKRMQREWRLTWLGSKDGGVPTKEFATKTGQFKRPKKQNPVRPRALSPKLQCAHAPYGTVDPEENPPYSAPTRPMAISHRAPTRHHVITIPKSTAAQDQAEPGPWSDTTITEAMAAIRAAVQAEIAPSKHQKQKIARGAAAVADRGGMSTSEQASSQTGVRTRKQNYAGQHFATEG
jgi:hypothetical protein